MRRIVIDTNVLVSALRSRKRRLVPRILHPEPGVRFDAKTILCLSVFIRGHSFLMFLQRASRSSSDATRVNARSRSVALAA